MQSLWKHPNFLQIQNTPQFGIDLRSSNLHTPERIKNMNFQTPYWRISLVHQDITQQGLHALGLLALNRQALNWMQAMQRGELVNSLEGSPHAVAALHTALRANQENGMLDIAKKVRIQAIQERSRIKDFVEAYSDFNTLVVLGIGGSQLGPEALYEAIKPFQAPKREVVFIPNIDPKAHKQWADRLPLKKTVVAAISKSGSTLETAESEKWWRSALTKQGLHSSKHMVAITTPGSRLDRPEDFLGVFYFDSSIGGRYSATSSVGALPLAFAYGMQTFERLLQGASEMDAHARDTPWSSNGPLALACISIWQRQLRKRLCQGIIAYRQSLHRLAAHLQQLEMESLGKCTDKQRQPLEGYCGPLIMGEPGTCAQHSFFQWMHQGTDCVPIDFIIEMSKMGSTTLEGSMADQLIANALAQSLALAKGYASEQSHQVCPGNRPSTILACSDLSPETIGALLALYEHKTAFEGFILGINPFDQEGVELGKRMAKEVYQELEAYRAQTLQATPWWAHLMSSN